MGVQRSQADAVHQDKRSPLLAAERDRRGQPVVPTRALGWPATPTSTPIASTAAAAAPAVHVTMRDRRRRQLTLASRDGSNSSGNDSTPLRSSIAANSSR